MRISANFATYSGRKDVIDRAVLSIIDQVDIVRVHYNDYTPNERQWQQHIGEDYTDRAKFLHIQEGEIAFTCDDDILYPPDYVTNTLRGLYKHGVVSYHGRKLEGMGRDYYKQHTTYHFMRAVNQDKEIDVPGTGVMAFDTRKFMPNIMKYPQNKTVDLLFALEAAKSGVKMTCLKHKRAWITSLPFQGSIHREMSSDCTVQNCIADEIQKVNKELVSQ